MVRVRRSWMIWAAPGKSIQSGTWTALMVRRTRRPWLLSLVVTAGTSCQGKALHAARRVGWLAFTVSTYWPPRPVMWLAVSRWQCIASALTTASVMSMLSSRSRRAGISLLLEATASWPRTAPADWSNAATRCGAPAVVRAPRMVLPSTAMTRRPARCPTRVAIHPASRASRSSASSMARVRRIVDSDGSAWFGSIPMRDNMSRSASWVHSAIARRVCAPASTAVWASVSTVAKVCRTPLGSRGSGTCSNTSISGRRDSPAVGEDDMAAGDFRNGRCVETRSSRGVPCRPSSNTRHISHTRNRRSAALSAYFADPLLRNRGQRPRADQEEIREAHPQIDHENGELGEGGIGQPGNLRGQHLVDQSEVGVEHPLPDQGHQHTGQHERDDQQDPVDVLAAHAAFRQHQRQYEAQGEIQESRQDGEGERPGHDRQEPRPHCLICKERGIVGEADPHLPARGELRTRRRFEVADVAIGRIDGSVGGGDHRVLRLVVDVAGLRLGGLGDGDGAEIGARFGIDGGL